MFDVSRRWPRESRRRDRGGHEQPDAGRDRGAGER